MFEEVHGQLAAWCCSATGRRRASLCVPTRSAVLVGLVGLTEMEACFHHEELPLRVTLLRLLV